MIFLMPFAPFLLLLPAPAYGKAPRSLHYHNRTTTFIPLASVSAFSMFLIQLGSLGFVDCLIPFRAPFRFDHRQFMWPLNAASCHLGRYPDRPFNLDACTMHSASAHFWNFPLRLISISPERGVHFLGFSTLLIDSRQIVSYRPL